MISFSTSIKAFFNKHRDNQDNAIKYKGVIIPLMFLIKDIILRCAYNIKTINIGRVATNNKINHNIEEFCIQSLVLRLN